jgi:hypothetical protein
MLSSSRQCLSLSLSLCVCVCVCVFIVCMYHTMDISKAANQGTAIQGLEFGKHRSIHNSRNDLTCIEWEADISLSNAKDLVCTTKQTRSTILQNQLATNQWIAIDTRVIDGLANRSFDIMRHWKSCTLLIVQMMHHLSCFADCLELIGCQVIRYT